MPTPLLALTLLAATWTVDDDQPADFPSIAAAVAAPAVGDGDALLVSKGTYGPFSLTKALAVLGPSAPATAEVTGVSSLVAAGGGSVSRLSFAALRIAGVPGRVRVTDCMVGEPEAPSAAVALEVDGCAEVLLSGVTVVGRDAPYERFETPVAMRIAASRAVVAGGSIHGGDGTHCWYCVGGEGGIGLLVEDGADVVVAGVDSIRGGAGGEAYCGLSACDSDGQGGDGVVVDGAAIRLRGTPGDLVGAGTHQPAFGGTPGHALRAAGSTVVSSGVTFDGAIDTTTSVHVTPATPEPFLDVAGPTSPGTTPTLTVGQGPDLAPMLLLASPHAALLDVPGFEGPLWIDPAQPFGLAAGTSWGSFAFPLPTPDDPTLAGVALDLQVAFPTHPGTLDPTKAFLANPVPVAIGPP